MSINWRMDKEMWYIYTAEYYLCVKNHDTMKFAGKQMELENIILSEGTQNQKDKHGMSSFKVDSSC